MSSAIASIARQATRQDSEPLNIITFPTHERYEVSLAKTNTKWYAIRANGIKDWDSRYAQLPNNYILLNKALENKQLPPEISYDAVLCQNRLAQFQMAAGISRSLHIPLICSELTLPPPNWPPQQIAAVTGMRGHFNVYLTEYSKKAWGGAAEDIVIRHGIDTELFKPFPYALTTSPFILSVVNDWINRDVLLGFNLWRQTTQNLPVKVLGATPGLSEPAKSVEELVQYYQNAQIFYNTSIVSPVPSVLLEAMACGCAVVSTATCEIPSIIQHGVNGLLGSNPQELRQHLETLMQDGHLRFKLGQNARKTIMEKYTTEQFLRSWNGILDKVKSHIYRG